MGKYGVIILGKKGGSFLAPKIFKSKNQARTAVLQSRKLKASKKLGFQHFRSFHTIKLK